MYLLIVDACFVKSIQGTIQEETEAGHMRVFPSRRSPAQKFRR